MSQPGWAGGLILFSLLLSVGWVWLKNKRVNDHPWQVEEQWLGRTAQFFYFVGVPYLGIVLGIVPARLLGLKGLEYFVLVDLAGVPFQRAVAEIQYAFVLMLLEWLVDSRATIIAGLMALVLLGGIQLGLTRWAIGVETGSHLSILRIIYDGLHWAFYRAIFWLITDDLYLGVMLGASLVILEWILVAWLQKSKQTRPQLLMNIIILILTAAVFFYSPNLWLLWPVHLAMVIITQMSLKIQIGQAASEN